MFKRLLALTLIITLTGFPALAKENIGNDINNKEYPDSQSVLPQKSDKNNNFVIEGSVEKALI